MTSWLNWRAKRKPGATDRVLINGVDVTYWRMTRSGDQPIRPQGYQLTEPFGYGSASLTIPRINPDVEQFGVGDRAWIQKGARVEYQRILPGGSHVTDYVGFVAAIQARNGALTLDIQGALSGRLAMIERQPPVFRRLKDLGNWVYSTLKDSVGMVMTQNLGPVTGIQIPDAGGMTQLAWMEQLCAMSQTSAGAQRTVMPETWGSARKWTFNFKDTTTKSFTLFADGARISVDVSDDAAEQPNVWFGSGVAPNGMRWRNAKAPGITAGDPPPWPMSGSTMPVGTTDSGTTTGSGVSVLTARLIQEGYLTALEQPDLSVYTTATRDAVKELQADVHLSVTGTMTETAWNRLFNINYVGYSFAYAAQFPLVQDPRIPYWIYTSNGTIADRNDQYDRNLLRVDRTIDFGPGTTKRDGVRWARGAQARANGKNWTGTITLNGFGGFAGEWDGGTDPGAANMMRVRDIRPGMNAWLPYFDGGTLFHVSGVHVSDDLSTVTLTVDTQARDLLELQQIIARNRDSRRDLRREWAAVNRNRKPSGNQITWDEIGGQLTYDKALPGNKWTVIPIPCGQQGQVNRVNLVTTGSAAAFGMCVFAKEVTRSELGARIGNPLAAQGDPAWWEDSSKLGDWLDNRWLLYAAGEQKQPCGYWPRKHTNDAGITTTAPITGKWRDDANWAYICDAYAHSVLWLAIYPDRDCTLKAGTVFYKQEDDAI